MDNENVQKSLPSFGNKLDKFYYLGKRPVEKRKFLISKEHEEGEEKKQKCFKSNNNNHQLINRGRQSTTRKQNKKLNTKQTYAASSSSLITQLKPLKPLLAPELRCVFVGFNPGIETARVGHYYAHRSNRFWKLLYESGCVDEKLSCKDDRMLLEKYQYGFHDLVARPTKGISELSSDEMLEGVPLLEQDLAKVRPRVVAIIGKGIWESIYRYKKKRKLNPKNFKWGVQPSIVDGKEHQSDDNKGLVQSGYADNNAIYKDINTLRSCCFLSSTNATIVVLPSTSGLVVSPSSREMLALWKDLHMTIIQAESDDLKVKT